MRVNPPMTSAIHEKTSANSPIGAYSAMIRSRVS